MVNIPGIIGYIQPQVISRSRTLTRAVSIPGGLRVLSITGEGRREETIIDSAKGDGTDGFMPNFTTPADGYGRFFKLSNFPIISNRTNIYLNGSSLRILESTIDSSTFSSIYDARLEIATGHIELQRASLEDFGNQYYSKATTNVGDGYLQGLTLVDSNAPAETWTIRCASVIRDSYGAPIRHQASFTASGSTSGQIKDAYGQPFIWRSDGITVSNGILSFAIFNPPSSVVFEVGDKFTVSVTSKVLKKNDQLTAKYIAELDLNTAETFTDPNALFVKHGQPSLENALSLGAQMAFNNGATSVLTVQAKPPLPRRTSEIVLAPRNTQTGETGATGNATEEDLIFDITAPGKPDVGTSVHFFIENEDGTEVQIFPNKVDFYDPDITDWFAAYERDSSSTLLMDNFMNPATSGYVYSYTVVSDLRVEQSSNDGYLENITGGGLSATFHSNNIDLDPDSAGKLIDIHDTTSGNLGRFTIVTVVSEHAAIIQRVSGSFTLETNLRWQLLPADTAGAETSQRILFTTDLALARYKGLRITYIDTKDADFFDPGWAEVIDVLESQELQMIVPLPAQTFSSIIQSFLVHVEKMSSPYYKKERLLFTGALQGLTPANVLGNTLAAVEDLGILEGIQGDSAEEILSGNIEDLANYSVVTNFGDSFRVVYMYPDEIIRVVSGERTVLPGYFMAAAATGYLAGQPNIALPLTNKVLVDFTIGNDRVFKTDILNQLGAAGITVVQPVAGASRVLHGKTTTQSGFPEEEEISIVFIRDQISRTMRQSFQTFIGSVEDPTLLATLTARAIGLLSAFVSQNLITAFRNLSVQRDLVEPRQFNITFDVQPVYPIDWLFIDFSIGIF